MDTKRKIQWSLTLCALLLGSGCITKGSRNLSSTSSNGSIVHTDTGSSGSSGSGSSSDSSTDSSSGNSTGTEPLQYTVRGVGYDATYSVTVYANKTLRVKFKSKVQDRAVSGTNFYAQYTGLGVYIKVGSNETPTPLVHNGVASTEEQSPVYDFSGSYTHTCSTSDTSCRQAVTITVKKPNYDYWCYNYPNGFVHTDGKYYNLCYSPGWTHVYSTHPWVGQLIIQTDDTKSID